MVEEPEPGGEHARVVAWEALRLVALGFKPNGALRLAEGGVGWHDAKRILDAGCDHRTAARILRPLTPA